MHVQAGAYVNATQMLVGREKVEEKVSGGQGLGST